MKNVMVRGVDKFGTRVTVCLKIKTKKLKTKKSILNVADLNDVEELDLDQTTLEDDLKLLTAKELAKKYLIKDANGVAKKLGVKRPRVDGKLIKEVEYWNFLLKHL